MKKKMPIIAATLGIVVVLIAVTIGIISCAGRKNVDAAGYVQANLDLIFQGETQEAKRFISASNSDLKQIYDNGIQAFVSSYLTGGIDTGEMFSDSYGNLVKQIFRTMRYRVGDAVKKEDGSYEVTVTFRPTNVFTVFIPQLQAESEKITKKAEEGAYTGSEDEIESAMLLDYMKQAYSLLESAYIDMEYGEEQEFKFTVSVGKKNSSSMDETEINTFIERILELDKL